MRLVVLVLTVLSFYLFSSSAEAATSCFGAPADYVAAFDAKDGATDGQVDYPEPRVYIEVQSWVTRPGETPGHHSEHIHNGACFPQGETWGSLASRLDYRHIFHNVVGYNVASVRGGFVDTGAVAPKDSYTSAQIGELNRAADASAGTETFVYQSYPVNFSGANCSGRAEFRTGLDLRGQNVGQPGGGLVVRWFTSTGWQSNLPGSKSKCGSGRDNNVIISRSWVSKLDYGNNGFKGNLRVSAMSAARPDPFSVMTDLASGARDATLHVDPNFHVHPDDPGVWSKSAGETTHSVPTGGLAPGIHRLVYIAHEGGGSVQPIKSTVVTVIPFRVGGEAPPPPPPPDPEPEPDTEAPSAPSNLRQVAATPTSITLAWDASTDNVGVDHYDARNRGVLAGTTSELQFEYAGLTCGTEYPMGVGANDAAGNESPQTWAWFSTAPCQ